MSSYYTIPATPNTPYPTLPISFPNLAAYLASAADDSRGMARDDRSDMRRLAKTLDTLYPTADVGLGLEDNVSGESDGPASSVAGSPRNASGRTRRDPRRNDSHADLVTPFVPEWG